MRYEGSRFLVIDLVNSNKALHKLLAETGCDHFSDTQALDDLLEGCEYAYGDKVLVSRTTTSTTILQDI